MSLTRSNARLYVAVAFLVPPLLVLFAAGLGALAAGVAFVHAAATGQLAGSVSRLAAGIDPGLAVAAVIALAGALGWWYLLMARTVFGQEAVEETTETAEELTDDSEGDDSDQE